MRICQIASGRPRQLLGRRSALARLGLVAAALFLLWANLGQSDELDQRKVVGNIPAKVQGRWPNDARDTFWYSDYETAIRVARKSGRPLFLVINRGAVCEV